MRTALLLATGRHVDKDAGSFQLFARVMALAIEEILIRDHQQDPLSRRTGRPRARVSQIHIRAIRGCYIGRERAALGWWRSAIASG